MDNPFEGWGGKEDVYPAPPEERLSRKEIADKLLDALIVAMEGGDKEEIEAIKEQLTENNK
jgi:hypothetical protein